MNNYAVGAAWANAAAAAMNANPPPAPHPAGGGGGHAHGHAHLGGGLLPLAQVVQNGASHHHAHHPHHHHHHHPRHPHQAVHKPAPASSSSAQNAMNSSNGGASLLLRDLAFMRKRPVEGRSTRSIPSSQVRHLHPPGAPAAQRPQTSSSGGGGGPGGAQDTKTVDFLYYSESEDEDDDDQLTLEDANSFRLSCNFTECLRNRELGLDRRYQPMRLSSEYGTRHILSNSMLREYPEVMPNLNKIFCSTWLSHRQVVFGTKCNQLMVYDVNTRHLDRIPSLLSSENSQPFDSDSGIHAIEINPSKTLLATGAKNAKDIAVYRLPTLDPICVGEGAHADWIFDLAWLDDQFLVSGSRDGTLALWRVTDDLVTDVVTADIPGYQFARPLMQKNCKAAEKVRSVCYNHMRKEFAVISLNGYIHCWDATRFKQMMSKRLPHTMENVCLATDEDAHMYAVGSKANTDLLDARTLQAIKKIPSRNNGCGIRSVSFKGNLLTIGTGIGLLLFWDLRAGKFLESTMNSNRAVSFKASRGWVQRDEMYAQNMDGLNQSKYLPAIYTHCFDDSGTRLFAAGGPLQCGLKGNYMALFQ